MQLKNVPAIGPRYWVIISMASVFGANMGDFVSHNLGLGHLNGVPVLAALFAGALLAERVPALAGEAWYWVAVVLARTAATNLGDLATHDLRTPYPLAVVLLAALLAAIVLAGQRTIASGDAIRPATDAKYWAAMLTAGTLGTVAGDYVSGDLGFGSGYGTVLLGAGLAVVLWLGSFSGWASKLAYWSGIVMVRSAGTTLGDFIPFRHGLNIGLPLSTALTGALMLATVVVWRRR